ncbi:hypothetical protein MVEG_11032 [Podila verticillata NRRL 6337]|uniref:Ras modification protein ERF4 n=1 Tax=Podila verticillata NRRL 6337 TaxID=1069443 RepID=A0A086TM17_9FUNG|nr:hypothetical protein MVEG_11032 [Podila verticillata NRRL 6337]
MILIQYHSHPSPTAISPHLHLQHSVNNHYHKPRQPNRLPYLQSSPPLLPTLKPTTQTPRPLCIQPSTGGAGYLFEQPSGVPRCIVRIDRDHDAGDEATRFEVELFPVEFVERVTRAEFKATVNGINEYMRVAEESILNCLDTLLDCLTAYTAKHCCGTHYQRALRKMETFIHHENERVYHPARIHLRDPQKVGMIYLEFEVF